MFTLVDLILLIYMVFQKFINCYLSLSIFLFTLLFTLLLFLFSLKYVRKDLPSKHFLFSKTSSRRLEDVFSVTLFVFQDVFKTYLQYVFLKRLQDVFARRLAIMSSRRLQDVLEDKKMLHWRHLQDIFCTSSPRRMFAGWWLITFEFLLM